METSETIRPDKGFNAEFDGSVRHLGKFRSVLQQAGNCLLFYEHANLLVQFVTSEIVRVQVFLGVRPTLSSTAAVMPQQVEDFDLTVHEETKAVILQAGRLQVVIEKHPFNLKTFWFDEKFIHHPVNGAEGKTVTGDLAPRPGEVCFETADLYFNSKGGFVCWSRADETSHFYGLGEKTGFLDKRGERYEMWNSDVYAPHVPEIEALYLSIPYLLHSDHEKTYGLFLDNPGRTSFDMRSRSDAYSFTTETGALDFYVIHGASLKEVTKNYTGLTGRMPLPPRWAIGYHQSRYSYMNQAEVLELARTFRAKEIPCDGIHLDIHYMDGFRVFTFDEERFPNPKAMTAELAELGFHVVPIVDPGVKQDARYAIYREGVLKGYFCKRLEGDLFLGEVWPGKSAFPDFTDEEVRRWWGQNHEFYVENGIHGIWNDMNEPAVFSDLKTMEPDVIHRNDGDPKTHAELHNLYGMLMSKATYEGLREQLQGERPFVLTRSGYAGVQRYAAVWTGDNRSFWEHMAMAIPMVLNLGLSGVAFTGPDIGGFAHHTTGELLARWMQMGALFPFSRNHSALDTVRQEPWSFGPEVEKICRDYIQLRYRWMPYLYSLFFEAAQTGLPVMRPLVLEYPEDPYTINLSDQFLLGEGVLVAPIYRPHTEHRVVYLPHGVWYDYWTGTRYEGSQHILVYAPLERLPLFIKGGAILPEVPLALHASTELQGPLTLHFYTGGEGLTQFRLYEDDGITFEYLKGVYNEIEFELEEEVGKVVIRYRYHQQGFPKPVQYGWNLHIGPLAFTPSEVHGLSRVYPEQFNQGAPGWTYEDVAKELRIYFHPGDLAGQIVIS